MNLPDTQPTKSSAGSQPRAAHRPLPSAGIHPQRYRPQFIAQALRDWFEASDTTSTADIQPGFPWETGFVESFNGRFRDEFLNSEPFATAPEAQLLADRWRWE